MSNAQEKLNKIDELLYKAGFREPDTVSKVMDVIRLYKSFKNRSVYNQDLIDSAIEALGGERE